MKITGTQIRKGVTIIFKGEPWKVIDFDHRTPGNYNPIITAKIKNIFNGTTTDQRFRPTEQLEKVDVETIEMEYIYAEADSLVFMNTQSYEQIPISKEFLFVIHI